MRLRFSLVFYSALLSRLRLGLKMMSMSGLSTKRSSPRAAFFARLRSCSSCLTPFAMRCWVYASRPRKKGEASTSG